VKPSRPRERGAAAADSPRHRRIRSRCADGRAQAPGAPGPPRRCWWRWSRSYSPPPGCRCGAARRRVGLPGSSVSTKAYAGGILLLGRTASSPPPRSRPWVTRRRSTGKPPNSSKARVSGDGESWHVVPGHGALSADNADAGKNNFIWASKACEAEGGWLPSPAADRRCGTREARVGHPRLPADLHDRPDPTRGLKDEREMSSTLVTTEAGSAAAGSRASAKEPPATHARSGQPIPLPANPTPESLQYVTVYDNFQKGGFAGSQPSPNRRTSAVRSTRPPAPSTRGILSPREAARRSAKWIGACGS